MYRILAALALVAFLSEPAAASDKTDVMAVVHQTLDAFNKGDIKSTAASCADEASIIDDFPPHAWLGTGACAKWASDFEAEVKTDEVTDVFLKLGRPRHLDITGDRAYVVIPADLTYKMRGKPMKQNGSIWTLALQKGDSGWRITAWAWGAARRVEVKGGP